MFQDYAVTKRDLELNDLRTFAHIYEREDGGPIIDLITGREPHTVGTVPCIKADMRSLPWESEYGEQPLIKLCEVASPVISMMTQPHMLEMKVIGEPKSWWYRPDLKLIAEASFVDMIENDVPFAMAVADWRPSRNDYPITLIVEAKTERDPRNNDPDYLLKLELAEKVYNAIGWKFRKVVNTLDLDLARIQKSARAIMLDHDTSLAPPHIDKARAALRPFPHPSRLADVVAALGGGALGRARASALHVRRLISIDLTHDMQPDTPVRRMPKGAANFEMKGDFPW